jgi:hypothetical protein
MRRPLPTLALDEELPDCVLPDTEVTPEEELEKADMIHVRCVFPLFASWSDTIHCGRTH